MGNAEEYCRLFQEAQSDLETLRTEKETLSRELSDAAGLIDLGESERAALEANLVTAESRAADLEGELEEVRAVIRKDTRTLDKLVGVLRDLQGFVFVHNLLRWLKDTSAGKGDELLQNADLLYLVKDVARTPLSSSATRDAKVSAAGVDIET